jgi:hypothetical protein
MAVVLPGIVGGIISGRTGGGVTVPGTGAGGASVRGNRRT